MSSHVFVKVKMRAVGARRFVREFKKEYGDRIIVHKWQLPQMFTNHKCKSEGEIKWQGR